MLVPKKIGFSSRKEDIENIIYFWAVIGHLLGISDDYNICIGNYEQVNERCEIIFRKNFQLNLITLNSDSLTMVRQIIEAMGEIVPGLYYKPFFKYILNILLIEPNFHLTSFEKIFYQITRITFLHLLHYQISRLILNNLLRLSFYLLHIGSNLNNITKKLEKKEKKC